MFKQVKSALFWYYLYKFRKRVLLICFLLLLALFTNAIYADILEYLKLKEQLQYLEVIMLSKWFVILFSLLFSIYLILTIFKKDEEKKQEKKTIKEDKIEASKNEKFTQREKKFLYKKKLKTKADILVEQ